MKVYQVVERRHGKVYELLDTAPPLEGLARAFARAALKRALDDLHQARAALTRAATRLQAERARAWPCCRDQRRGRNDPHPVWVQAMRTEIGRPKSSMRFSAWTATSTSVARRWSVRERNPSPITCLNLPMVASTRARVLYPDAFCHPILPFSAMNWRCPSRCVGAVSAVSLGTAVERGGTMTTASGWRSATLMVTPF